MREIKYRAWVKQQKRMVDVDIINFRKNELSFAENIGNWQVGGCWFPIETIELMQYTGLHDKNGKEIYENDIVEYEDDATGERYYSVVKWDEDDACYFITLDDEYNQLNGDIDYLLEVIGNIYENPELLEEI